MRQDNNGVYYLSDYKSWHGGNNPEFSKITGGFVLDVKDNLDIGINHFTNEIIKGFGGYTNLKTADAILTCMPRSTKNEIRPGMIRLLKSVCDEYTNMKYEKCLNRNKTIPKKANGGIRNIDVELESLDVCGNIQGKQIFLLDDVTTTGNSLLAGKKKLIDAGAKKVIMIALGKTI